ncbi:hypothetical protein BV455_01988 [Parageobacillus caldoxylosilyticus]|uniref:hypothetical protein n=1 Tax=Saccharococcus caldoxylosilyticus TaxID=81408 RepID=UPI001C4DE67A|nr:hypothetical protein [Parageobacillus caldoxylosilyticus]QXJ38644.1 hypothetical protein BV455_01988 [Parageobacillus caldoxylosilyticus]
MNLQNFNTFEFVLIIYTSFVMWLVFQTLVSKKEKFFLTVSYVGFGLYSGLGISSNSVDNKYMLSYFLFLFAYSTAFVIVVKLKQKEVSKNIELILQQNKTFFLFLGTIYILSICIPLVYPNIRILDLFHPEPYKISSNIFLERIERQNDIVFNIRDWVTVLCKPFYWFLLYQVRRKPKMFLFLLLSPVYIEYIVEGYIGRSEIVMWVVFIILYLYYERYISRLQLIVLSVILVLISVPVLNMMFYWRNGWTLKQSWSYLDLLSSLLLQETTYPQNYNIAVEISSYLTPLDFFYWLVTLPVPSILIKSAPLSLNHIFSVAVRGIEYGEYGFYVVLPSILGEGFMLYGEDFAWVHGVVLGIIFGLFINAIKNIEEFKYWYLYFVLWSLLGFRGGSQAVIAQIVNGSILVLGIFIYKNLFKSNFHQLKKNH